MSHANHITLITQDTTLSGLHDVYLVNAATGTTGFNITLPSINGNDGINYELIREDNTIANIRVQPTGENVIYQNLSGADGSTGNITLLPQTTFSINSYQDNWYVTNNTSIQRTSSKSLFTTAFSSNNGNALVLSAAVGVTGTVCYFSYGGTVEEFITQFSVVITNPSPGTTGMIQLWNTTPPSLISSLTIPPKINIARRSTNVISNLSMTSTVIAVMFVGTGTGSNAMSIYSLTVK